MWRNWPFRILGVCLILWGTRIIIDPVYYSSKYRMSHDFSDIEWLYGGGLILIGLLSVWTTIRKKKENVGRTSVQTNDTKNN
jgi:hypothetical protein